MKLTTRGLISVSLMALIFLSFGVIRAQNTGSYTSIPAVLPELEEQISVNVSPENPGPGQPVVISLEAYGTDLNRAQISWLVDGKVAQNGIGLISYNFTTGKPGNSSLITIYILPNGTGNRITKEISITPANVDIAWESPASSVPLFYKGKALYPHAGALFFVAMPNLRRSGASIDPKTLIYQWNINGTNYADKSGYGKNTFLYISNVLDQVITVSVKASTVDNSVVGEGSTTVSPINSQVVIYEDSPLYGQLFNQALVTEFPLRNNEAALIATPYYFSIFNQATSSVKYSWTNNNAPLDVPADQNKVVFRRPDGVEGQSRVTVTAKNAVSILQNAGTSLMVNFNNTSINSNVTF